MTGCRAIKRACMPGSRRRLKLMVGARRADASVEPRSRWRRWRLSDCSCRCPPHPAPFWGGIDVRGRGETHPKALRDAS